MGVDIYVLNFLAATHAVHKRSLGRTLMLGRQGFHITTPEGRAMAQSILRAYDPHASLAEIQPADERWANGLLGYLGSTSVSALDFSPFEGADIVHDLNLPVPDRLHASFDTIFDGGTIEHVFDIPMALRNVGAMLTAGGLFLSVNAANNQLGHGLYQFSPELMWRAFGPENGFSVEAMYLTPIRGRPSLEEAPDPRAEGRRLEVGMTAAPTYLFLAARRVRTHSDGPAVYQSDYSRAWESAMNAQLSKNSNAPTAASPSLPVMNPASARPSGAERWRTAAPRRRGALHKTWRELNDLVGQELAEEQPPHHMIGRFTALAQSPHASFASFVASLQKAFEADLLQTYGSRPARGRIPPFTHRMWLTADENGALPPDDLLENYLGHLTELPTAATHFFWTNSETVLRHVRARAAALGLCNLVPCLSDIYADDPAYDNVRALIAARKFVLAADVLKFLVLHRFGGVYADLGVRYDAELFDLLRCAEYGLLAVRMGFFQTSFIGASSQSDLTSAFLAVLSCPDALDPAYALAGKKLTGSDEVRMFAGASFTVTAMLFLSPAARALVVPPQSPHLRWRAERSWYGSEPKHGNTLVAGSPPAVLTEERLRATRQELDRYVLKFGNAHFLSEQVKVLIAARDFFARNPTRMCEMFHFHGSDKSFAWHNYGYVYNHVLGARRRRVRNILEVGIGTNMLDMPSTMGVTGIPGASLRAWREIFPAATVVGADVDKRILFQDDGIETYYVDQTDSETVAALFAQLGGRRFDLIIDDGLHTFPANTTLLSGAFQWLAEGGLYVVEDVMDADVPMWESHLRDSGYDAVVATLPHATNRKDNRLVFIEGRSRG